jgi:tetratricopeptide (TPR) repeat protein
VSINSPQATSASPRASVIGTNGMNFLERFAMSWKAKLFLFIGKRDLAAGVFEQMLAKDANNVYALNSLGYDALLKKHFVLSHQYFEKVLSLKPDLSASHFNVAFVASELDRLPEAETHFRAALAIEEKMDRAWYGLGLLLIRQRRFGEAITALKRNTQLQPMSPFGWYQMARVHMELAQPDEAQKILRHLNGFEPKVAKQLARETGLMLDGQ